MKKNFFGFDECYFLNQLAIQNIIIYSLYSTSKVASDEIFLAIIYIKKTKARRKQAVSEILFIIGCVVDDLPTFANAGILDENNLVYAVTDTVTYYCNDNFAPEPDNSLPTCTCIPHPTDPSTASWTCEPTSFTDACQPVSTSGKYYCVTQPDYFPRDFITLIAQHSSAVSKCTPECLHILCTRYSTVFLRFAVLPTLTRSNRLKQVYGLFLWTSCLGCFEDQLPEYANAFVSSGGGLQFYAMNDVVVYACQTGFTSQSANGEITCTCDVNIQEWFCNPPAEENSEPCQPVSNPSTGNFLHTFCLSTYACVSGCVCFFCFCVK